MSALLLDYIMSSVKDPSLMAVGTPKTREQSALALKTKMYKARKYFVNEDVTFAAATMGVDQPETLIQLLRRARIPSRIQTIYVEWFNRTAIEANGEKFHPDAPEKIGCLIESVNEVDPMYRITLIGIVAGGASGITNRKKLMGISPISYLFRTDEYPPESPDLPLIMAATGFDEEWLQKANVGTAYVNSYRKLMEDLFLKQKMHGRNSTSAAHLNTAYNACKEFQKHCTVVLTPMVRKSTLETMQLNEKMMKEYLRSDIVESAGTWRFVVSLLALMNEHEYTVQTAAAKPKGGSPRLINGKIAPFIEHIVVGLKLPRKVVEDKLKQEFSNQESSPKRGHDVDGSWRTFKSSGLRSCDHVYEYEEESNTRMRCIHENCKKLKFWVPGYKRGNFSLGEIIKTRVLQIQ